MAPLGKILMFLGAAIFGVGVILLFTDKIPFLGKLPGDISVKKENFQVFFPITTSILLSILISLILWLISFLNKK